MLTEVKKGQKKSRVSHLTTVEITVHTQASKQADVYSEKISRCALASATKNNWFLKFLFAIDFEAK